MTSRDAFWAVLLLVVVLILLRVFHVI